MDSITQIVVGIATVEALAGKELKNKSFLVGAILGTIPDLDIWIGKLFSYETELAFHRAFTHSILGILVLSPLFAFLLHRIWKQLSFKKWLMIVAATFSTHILIDLFTSWGVQLLYPLPDRFSFKTIFVVDLFYTIPWIIALLLLNRKTEMATRKRMLKRGFYISSSYLLLTVAIKLFVVSKVETFCREQNLSSNFTVKPTFSNCILWNITFNETNKVHTSSYSLFDKKPITIEKSIPVDQELKVRFKENAPVQKLVQASENWYNIEQVNNSTFIFNDLRFGSITKENGKEQFVFSYEIALQKNQTTIIRPLPKQLRDGKETLRKTWDRLKGK